jgi:hypothetical protein
MTQTQETQQQDELMIPIEKYLDDFNKRLNTDNRIMFSAKFGDGKTHFFEEFKEKYKDDYLFLTIYPVNYQVESNKDIFELIKRDILFQLFRDIKENLVHYDIDLDAFTTSLFSKDTLDEFFDFVGDLSNLFVPGAGVLGKFVKFATGVKARYDDNKVTWEKYLKKFQNMPGIYEFDPYTRLITEIVEKYKQNNDYKRVVLLIEDLDRIDPEHVFRILNIFSAHIDRKYMYDGEEQVSVNKFSLDKVVTVCDYDNLKCIFAHFYGAPTSFEGYINKFLERPPFRYSIKEAAIDYFYGYIQVHCGLPKDIVQSVQSTIKHETFDVIVRRQSVRELLNILNNIDNQIQEKKLQIQDVIMSTRNQCTRMLTVCKRLQFDFDLIVDCCDDIDFNILLKFLGTSFCYIRKQKNINLTYNKKESSYYIPIHYNLIYVPNSDILIETKSEKFANIANIERYEIENNVLRKQILKVIDYFKPYVHD